MYTYSGSTERKPFIGILLLYRCLQKRREQEYGGDQIPLNSPPPFSLYNYIIELMRELNVNTKSTQGSAQVVAGDSFGPTRHDNQTA